MRDSFIFYRSFAEAIGSLSNRDRLRLFDALIAYALDDVEPDLSGAARGMFMLIRPQIDANNRRYENGKKGAEHGSKGGRPKNPKETPNEPQENPKETPNENVNGNENLNVNQNENQNGNVSTDVDVWSLSRSVLSYLNSKAGSTWRVDDVVGVRLISDLSHQGYTEEQMKTVIDKKCDEWLGDPKMEHYLRPSTLFKPDNFVKYLNAPDSARRQKQEQDAEESRRIDEEIRKMKEDGERELARMKEAHEKFMRENGLRN